MADTASVTLAGGCFWCVEAVFKDVDGVVDTVVGYSGGHVEDPTYDEVCSGDTGHAEAVQVEYDPDRVSFRELLAVFFATHDPTTLNRQGPDVGSQYRSAIFYHTSEQHEQAEAAIEELQDDYTDQIVTEVLPLQEFYPAAEKHQDFFEKHPDHPYCTAHIPEKLETVDAMQD